VSSKLRAIRPLYLALFIALCLVSAFVMPFSIRVALAVTEGGVPLLDALQVAWRDSGWLVSFRNSSFPCFLALTALALSGHFGLRRFFSPLRFAMIFGLAWLLGSLAAAAIHYTYWIDIHSPQGSSTAVLAFLVAPIVTALGVISGLVLGLGVVWLVDADSFRALR